MKLHYLQHDPLDAPGAVAAWAESRGIEMAGTELDQGEALPPQDSFDALVILGGPMSAYDDAILPWLVEEKKFIREVVAQHSKRTTLVPWVTEEPAGPERLQQLFQTATVA